MWSSTTSTKQNLQINVQSRFLIVVRNQDIVTIRGFDRKNYVDRENETYTPKIRGQQTATSEKLQTSKISLSGFKIPIRIIKRTAKLKILINKYIGLLQFQKEDPCGHIRYKERVSNSN